jgi:hypothetical protein
MTIDLSLLNRIEYNIRLIKGDNTNNLSDNFGHEFDIESKKIKKLEKSNIITGIKPVIWDINGKPINAKNGNILIVI